ncbi:hypothetical protein FACS1894188_02380 [Clostridia bacterium]|nr:hypothetical protein FACS1894188_02380 [Clostridia bacterium]
MGQDGGYQSTIDKLYALYKEKGFLLEDEALAMMTVDGISLVGINRIIDRLVDKGVIFSDGSKSIQLTLDDLFCRNINHCTGTTNVDRLYSRCPSTSNARVANAYPSNA